MLIEKVTHATLLALLLVTGCGQDPAVPDILDHEYDSERIEQLPEGVHHTQADDGETWYLEGAAAHEWFRDYLVERAQSESETRAMLTWEMVDLIETSLDTLEDTPVQHEDVFRAKDVNAVVVAVYNNGQSGWKATADASKTGLPATLAVQTRALVNNILDEHNDNKWGTGSLHKVSQATMVSPAACYARAYARSGNNSAVQEKFDCPVPPPPPPQCTWTNWYDRDDPSGNGDYEDLNSLKIQYGVCANPTDIQCQTLGGVPHNQTGEVVNCTPLGGGWCVNASQQDGFCQDYRVKFCCP